MSSNPKVTIDQLISMIERDEDVTNIDVSNVTNMYYLFDGLTSFNQDIGNWDVGNVNSMHCMFDGAINFNQDLSSWDVDYRKVNMEYMFNGCDSIPNVTNCGDKNITVYKKQVGKYLLYFADDFTGTYEELINKINSEYEGSARNAYIAKVDALKDM